MNNQNDSCKKGKNKYSNYTLTWIIYTWLTKEFGRRREVKNGITCTTNELKRSKKKQFFMYDSFAVIHLV